MHDGAGGGGGGGGQKTENSSEVLLNFSLETEFGVFSWLTRFKMAAKAGSVSVTDVQLKFGVKMRFFNADGGF